MSATPDDNGLDRLEARLRQIPGTSLSRNEPLGPRTTFRIGGPAAFLVEVQDETALSSLLRLAGEEGIPHQLLGLGSNVLLPDEGLPGITILLAGDFLDMRFEGTSVIAGAGLPLARVAKATVDRGMAGMEALSGFPSTVGGAVVMNAGCYGVEIRDLLEAAIVMEPTGTRRELGVEDLSAGYRSTRLQGSSVVVTQARLRLTADTEGAARSRLRDLNRRRREAMPLGRPNAGSVFKNPAGDHAGRLIDACGLKGTRSGAAEISEEHANVIVNNGGACAAEVLDLMRTMHRAVAERFGVLLEPELILWGSLAERWNRFLQEHATG